MAEIIERPLLAVVAAGCLVATVLWGRSANRLHRAWRRIDDGSGSDAADLARSAFRKEVHTALLYGSLAVGFGISSLSRSMWTDITVVLVLVPLALTVRYGPRFLHEARVAEARASLERRAEQVLEQETLAPRRWAARLAPHELPTFEGFEVGQAYLPGSGLMAGDFYDLFPPTQGRLAAVIGDVAGHGIDASITAFQTKYLLRTFLRQYRDPAQALEELNRQLAGHDRLEEFVSLVVVLFDQVSNTLRYASAGHPAAWLFHDGEVRPLRATGPLLMLDPGAPYGSREIPLESGDVLLLYTDGLTEARRGSELFGEERIAASLRRDPGAPAAVLCKDLLEAARDFSDTALADDLAILAVRRV
jgi:serine phosphatase RsbU (regulator of sigma subunit)